MNGKALLLGTAAYAIAAGSAFAQTGSTAPTATDRLEQLEKRIEEQAQEIRDLRAQINREQVIATCKPAGNDLAVQASLKYAPGSSQCVDAAAQTATPPEVSSAQFEALQKQVNETQAAVNAATPTDKKIHFKGITLTLGGFLAAESVWRSNNLESDIGSPGFSKIPFAGPGGGGNGNNVSVGHTGELRMSARQSRVQALVQGDVDPDTHLAMYGELDFLGGAASANSNESNSYQPRIRNLYGSADWSDIGVHFLFGQSWSFATLNSQGMSERSEAPPPTIEAQYSAGFVWTRQPQLRIVKNFDNQFWIGVSLENPQTTIGGTAPTGYTGLTVNSGSGFNGGSTNVALAEFNPGITLSLNQVPDVIGKIAWEPAFFGGNVHLEGVGIYRDFYDRFGTSLSSVSNHNVSGGGGGVSGLIKLVPGLFDLQFDTLFGQGIGRYGSSQLPDTTYNANGTLKGLSEDMEMVGLTWHATRALDLYVFGGREHEDSKFFNGALNGSMQHIGYGNPLFDNTGCFSFTSVATCTGNIQTVEQINVGTWDDIYNGDFGRLRIGLQYSYTYLKAFTGVSGAPHTSDNMVFTSFRYYPY
jgi:hypothetical protein